MTVINMISFGNEGVAVADEQASTALRKYNVAQKLHLIGNSFVYGGSGPSDYIGEIYKAIANSFDSAKKERDNIPLNEVYRMAQQISINHRRELKNNILLSNLGIGLDDFLTGTLVRTGQKLDVEVMKAAVNIVQQLDNEGNMRLVLGGLEDGKFEMYMIDSHFAGTNISRPYCSIGSGSDESEKALSEYAASLSRERRETIDRQEGLVKIIEATNASTNLNLGVGGSPSIVYASKEGAVIRPNEKQCVLASELVEGLTNGLLPQDFVYQNVSKLVYDNASFEAVEEEMQQRARDWRKLDRILRGYKE